MENHQKLVSSLRISQVQKKLSVYYCKTSDKSISEDAKAGHFAFLLFNYGPKAGQSGSKRDTWHVWHVPITLPFVLRGRHPAFKPDLPLALYPYFSGFVIAKCHVFFSRFSIQLPVPLAFWKPTNKILLLIFCPSFIFALKCIYFLNLKP